jgi:hypothetical protein
MTTSIEVATARESPSARGNRQGAGQANIFERPDCGLGEIGYRPRDTTNNDQAFLIGNGDYGVNHYCRGLLV